MSVVIESIPAAAAAPRNAYVMLIMRGDAYIPGAVVAAYSLRKVGAAADIVVMVTPDVTAPGRATLAAAFDRVVDVDYIEQKCRRLYNRKIEARYGAWKDVSFTKAHAMGLIEYAKVLLIDADIVVMRNMDDLFELAAPAATFSVAQARPYTHGGLFNPYRGKVRHGAFVPSGAISIGLRRGFVCIANCMLIAPNAADFAAYRAMIAAMPQFGLGRCVNGPDEQSICHFYHSRGRRWTHIDQAYNMIPWKEKWMAHSEFDTPFMWHFVAETKPWEYAAADLPRVVEKWPDVAIWLQYRDAAAAVAGLRTCGCD